MTELKKNMRAIADAAAPSRLVIAPKPIEGESLIGLVARATRENVLDYTKVILWKCAPRLLHPGTIGQDILDPERLAVQLGCSTDDITERCHPYITSGFGSSNVRWGSGAMSRSDLITNGRRISPASLKSSHYHRAAWMNRLLPYCAESLELLIDQCQICGKRQGWRRAWGIGNCDDPSCRAELRHASDELLPEHLVDGYRLFAQIVSPVASERSQAISRLDEELAALAPATLVHLIIQIGGLVQDPPLTFPRSALGTLSPLQIASCVAQGTNLILDWPRKLRSAVGKKLETLHTTEPKGRQKFIETVRRLGSRNVDPVQAELVAKAIPEAFEHTAIALEALVKPVVPANVICRTMSISPRELETIRVSGLIKHRVIAGGKRKQVQFDAGEFETLAECQQKSVFGSKFEQRFGLPRYATEQLACLGAIRREAHPALALINPTIRLVEESLDDFTDDVMAAASRGRCPKDAIPLGTASRILGGRPKPWGEILEAMRHGELRFWLSGEGKFARRAFVRPGNLIRFASTEFCEASYPTFPFKDAFTQVDAAEILNLDALQIRRSIEAAELSFRKQGVAMLTDRAPVLLLAASCIATSEIALRTGNAANKVPQLMKSFPNIGRCAAGWSRSAFDAEFGPL